MATIFIKLRANEQTIQEQPQWESMPEIYRAVTLLALTIDKDQRPTAAAMKIATEEIVLLQTAELEPPPPN